MYFTLDRTVFERSFFAPLKKILQAKKDTLLAGDFIREKKRWKNMEFNIFEAGIRYPWSP
jgi:hypothetical protein